MDPLFAVILGAIGVGIVGASDFADNLATCSAANPINLCLRETLEDLRPLMKVGIPGLGLAVAEPMAVDAISFQQGGREGLPSPVTIRSTFTNVVVEGLSTFRTDYIDADPDTQSLRIGLTVPVMDITGLYQINGEVFILPLEGSGSFSTKMFDVTAEGFSSILPVENSEGKQVLQVVDSNLDFKIGKVIIHMNNLFNGENELLANTVNKFLNDHGQEVLKEVKPAIRDQLKELVTRVMNDAFSSLPADQLLSNLVRSARSGQSSGHPQAQAPLPISQPLLRFPGGFNQERRGGNRMNLFSFLHGMQHGRK